jgi:hypothetical protein
MGWQRAVTIISGSCSSWASEDGCGVGPIQEEVEGDSEEGCAGACKIVSIPK